MQIARAVQTTTGTREPGTVSHCLAFSFLLMTDTFCSRLETRALLAKKKKSPEFLHKLSRTGQTGINPRPFWERKKVEVLDAGWKNILLFPLRKFSFRETTEKGHFPKLTYPKSYFYLLISNHKIDQSICNDILIE